MKKTTIMTGILLSSLIVGGTFAADADNATAKDNTATQTTNDQQNKNIELGYKVENGKANLIVKKNFTYSVDKYIYFDLQDGAFDKIKNMEVKLPGKTDKTNIVYVCSADENVMEISFEKYKEKVDKITDTKKQKECKTKFIYAVTEAGTESNTFKFNPDNVFVTLELDNNNYTNIPFSKIEMRNADNELEGTFDIKKVEEKKTVESKEKPKSVIKPQKEEKKVVNTKKTGLAGNVLLILLFTILFSAYNIKKRISE